MSNSIQIAGNKQQTMQYPSYSEHRTTELNTYQQRLHRLDMVFRASEVESCLSLYGLQRHSKEGTAQNDDRSAFDASSPCIQQIMTRQL